MIARDAISQVVRSVVVPSGGLCWLRAIIGQAVLKQLGIDAHIQVGAMLYRAGPDPIRDVVAFCGPGNLGYCDEQGFLGHVWLQADDDLIDFSSGDWQGPLTEIGPGLPPIRWTSRPPDYYWGGRHAFQGPWRGQGEPALGEAWYGPLAMDRRTTERLTLARLAANQDAALVLPHVRRNLERIAK